MLQKDPSGVFNNIYDIPNGSSIDFKVDGVGVFFGYVFKIGTDAEGNYKLTCYDSLRYLKNSDIYTFHTETASQIFEKICKDYDLKYEVATPISYVPSEYQFLNKNLYSIIKRGLDLASYNDRVIYYIIDDYGTIRLTSTNYEQEQLDVILGDNSVVTSFTYEKSIDKDTYNQVKLYRKDNTTGNILTWIVYDETDSHTISKWGVLQLFKQVDDKLNPSQIKERAIGILALKNRETETLRIQAEGVLECVAGKIIRFVLSQEGIDNKMWIKSSTHTFTKYEHTMDLEVEILWQTQQRGS